MGRVRYCVIRYRELSQGQNVVARVPRCALASGRSEERTAIWVAGSFCTAVPTHSACTLILSEGEGKAGPT